MTSRTAKLLVCALGFAVITASSADAAKYKRKWRPVASRTRTTRVESCRGADLFPCGPIYDGNQYLGTDPDPFIRLMIKRDLGVIYGDPD
jgi:hypothetical protein